MADSKLYDVLKGIFADGEGVLSSVKSLANSLKGANKNSMPDYDAMLPKTSGGVMKVYDEKSEEDLRKEAEASLKHIYNKNVSDVENKTEKAINALKTKLDEKTLKKNNDIKQATNDYAKDTETVINNAIAKGMTHSSNLEIEKDGVYKGFLSEVKSISENYGIIASGIETEITLMTAEKKSALLYYDMKKAAETESKIAELKAKQLKIIEEINKYNSAIAAAEAKYQVDRQKTIEDLEKMWLWNNK